MRWLRFKTGCVAVALSVSMIAGSASRGADEAKPADTKKTALTPAQQDAMTKLQAKGALVIPLAANSDALVISLANAGKGAGDPELELVKELPKVEQLDLRNTGITDKGLASIEGLTGLTMLHLENTAVTDAGLPHLKGLANLQYLNLFNTAVTDKGAVELAGLKNLKKLYLWQTKVTDAGAANLKKSLPGLYVNRGEELAITTQPATPIAAVTPAVKKPDEPKPAVAAVKPPAPAPTPVPAAAPAAVTQKPAPAPAPAVAAAPSKVDVAIEATVAAAKAAIDAKATEAKAAIDAKAAEAKAAIDKVAALRLAPAAAATPDAAAQLASTKIINTKCPLSGDPIDATQTVLFEGKTVALCCDKCKAKFQADPKKFIGQVVADAK